MFRPQARSIVSITALLLLGISGASADLLDVLPEFTELQRWRVFTLGSFEIRDALHGHALIQGDVGVAGAGDIMLANTSTIEGDLYYHSNGTADIRPRAVITGTQFTDQDNQLDNSVAAAIATSQHAASLQPTVFAPSDLVLRGNQNFIATGAPGETVVLTLGKFMLSDQSTFTLEGTATTTFIINVGKRFSLTGNASIVLADNVQWSNVLFNVRGRNGGVSLSGNSTFAGILMANFRTVRLSNSASVAGEVIANRVIFNRTSLKGGASVALPNVTSQ